MQSDNCTIKLNGLACTVRFNLLHDDDYHPGYDYEILALEYKGADVWAIWPDCAMEDVIRKVRDAVHAEAVALAQERAIINYKLRGI